jgi:hypothetical protein
MISDPRYNFVFVGVPKAATSSMRARLFRMGCADEWAQKSPLVEYPHAQHYTIREYRQILGDGLDSRFKFAFVRNPWDKVVSSFTKECSNWRNKDMARDYALDPKEFQKWAMPLLNRSRRAPDRFTSKWLGRTPRLVATPQLDFLTDEHNNIAVDFIGRFENVESDFETVLTKLHQIYPLPPRKFWALPKKNVSRGIDPRWPKEHYSFYYDDETLEKVRKVYAKDIEHFGYTYG